jgi:hypothetical protein
MDKGVDVCRKQRRPSVSTVRKPVDHNINVFCQYEQRKPTLTSTGRKKEHRAFNRKVSTFSYAWFLRKRGCLRTCHYIGAHSQRRIQLDSRKIKTGRKKLGSDRAVCCTRTLKKSWQDIVHNVT